MLYFMLKKRGHFHIEPDLFLRIGKIALSAIAMGGVLFYLKEYGADYYGGNTIERILSISLLCGAGAMSYFIIALFTGAIDRDKINLIRGRKTVNKE